MSSGWMRAPYLCNWTAESRHVVHTYRACLQTVQGDAAHAVQSCAAAEHRVFWCSSSAVISLPSIPSCSISCNSHKLKTRLRSISLVLPLPRGSHAGGFGAHWCPGLEGLTVSMRANHVTRRDTYLSWTRFCKCKLHWWGRQCRLGLGDAAGRKANADMRGLGHAGWGT